jgi:hypothetical protein
MKDNNWQKEYCKKFGLCVDEECNCKKEIKFISKLLKEQRKSIIEEIEKEFETTIEQTEYGPLKNGLLCMSKEAIINKLKQ